MAYTFHTTLAVAAAALAVAACDARTNRSAVPADISAAAGAPSYLGPAYDPYASTALTPLPPLGAPVSQSAPQSRAASWSPADRYRYIDRAYGMSYAFDDLPPDYVFDYGGVDPWVWQASNGGSWIVEPLDYGERYYYYEPGAYQPFFVRDPDYGYAYQNGVLIQVFYADGRPWTSGYTPGMRERAGRYRDRGQSVYYAAQRSPRLRDFGAWESRRPRLGQQARVWQARQTRDDGWRQWRSAEPARLERAVWEQERSRRRTRQVAYTDTGRGWSGDQPPPAFVGQPAQRWAGKGDDRRRVAEHPQRGERDQRRGGERWGQQEPARQQQNQRRGWDQQRQQAEQQQRAEREQRRGWERRGQQEQARQQQENQRRGWDQQRQQAEQQQRVEQEQRRGRERQQQAENQRRGWERQQQAQQQAQVDNQRRGAERQARTEQGRQQRDAERQDRQQQQRADRGGGGPQQVARNDRPDRGERGGGRERRER